MQIFYLSTCILRITSVGCLWVATVLTVYFFLVNITPHTKRYPEYVCLFVPSIQLGGRTVINFFWTRIFIFLFFVGDIFLACRDNRWDQNKNHVTERSPKCWWNFRSKKKLRFEWYTLLDLLSYLQSSALFWVGHFF